MKVKDSLNILADIVNNPDLVAKDGKSFCNIAVQLAAEAFGYTEKFEGKLANEIIDIMVSSKDWKKVDARGANALANLGGFAVAGARGVPHGHVATVAPGGMVYSGKWKRECPIVANVGSKNGFMGSNWAFVTEPGYFICLKTS
jgi:hypothetical protein